MAAKLAVDVVSSLPTRNGNKVRVSARAGSGNHCLEAAIPSNHGSARVEAKSRTPRRPGERVGNSKLPFGSAGNS